MNKTDESGALRMPVSARAPENDPFVAKRHRMVDEQIRRREIVTHRVLAAMREVPRHEFVPEELLHRAYADEALPIGEGQTISQPFMAAAMADALELTSGELVLEIGTGSGYQAAVLSQLAARVYSVESHPALAAAAQERLDRLGYTNVHVHTGDGTAGLSECAPFAAILVTAAAPEVPTPLLEQLADGGRLVIPVGSLEQQELLQVRAHGGRTTSRALHYCRFVPLVGRHGWPSAPR
jgi:protein-L-isoaspartate(D-aspartate) O-methyltransferase